jgi:hypothetical protein
MAFSAQSGQTLDSLAQNVILSPPQVGEESGVGFLTKETPLPRPFAEFTLNERFFVAPLLRMTVKGSG